MIIICANSHNHSQTNPAIIAVNGDPDVAAEIAVERGAIFDQEWNCADCVEKINYDNNVHMEQMFDSVPERIRHMQEDEAGICHIPSCACGGVEEHQ